MEPKRKKHVPKARESRLKAPPTRGPNVFDAQGKLLFSRDAAVQKKHRTAERRKRIRQPQSRHNEHSSGQDEDGDDERDEPVPSSEEGNVVTAVKSRKHTRYRRSSRKFVQYQCVSLLTRHNQLRGSWILQGQIHHVLWYEMRGHVVIQLVLPRKQAQPPAWLGRDRRRLVLLAMLPSHSHPCLVASLCRSISLVSLYINCCASFV